MPMRMAEKLSGSLGFSKKLKMSFTSDPPGALLRCAVREGRAE
jgi:hypothetical protein